MSAIEAPAPQHAFDVADPLCRGANAAPPPLLPPAICSGIGFIRALLATLWLLAFLPAQAGDTPSSRFLGWIPVQCVPSGDKLVIDMHRFFNPLPGDEIVLPSTSTAEFNAEKFELSIAIPSDARGLVEIPIRVVNGGEVKCEAVLTVAVQAPGVRPGPELPVVFAESQTPGGLAFRILASKDSKISQVSTVVELPEGSSRILSAPRDGDLLKIPTADIPDGSWIRVVAADDRGRVSRAIRAQVRPKEGFQWQDGIIYYAFTDRFVDGDKANDHPVSDPAVLPQANYIGGDFEGIQQKIEEGYFQKLGVNVLWLAPLNRNPDGAWKECLPPYRSYTGYHGYWPVSETEVEPRFGGEQGLKNLVGAARKSGIKIIADLVLRHVHVDNPLWKEHPDWFGSLTLPDGRKNLRLWDEQQFTTWFEEFLPGFDFNNPEPVAFLISNAGNWVEKFGLDGYRLDAVKHIRYSFWPKFRTAMRDLQQKDRMAPMYFVGETFMDRKGIMSFVGPNMLDGQFDFPLYDTIMEVFAKNQKGFAELEDSLSASETIYGKETPMSPLIGNHDKSRFMAYADGDLPDPKNDDEEEVGWANPPRVDNPASYEKLKLALSFLLSIDGVPMVYYGDEIGLTGAGDPDNRKLMPPESGLDAAQKSVREHFSKMTALRNAHPALRYGNRRLLVADSNRYAFVRRHFDDKVLAVWNCGIKAAEFNLQAGPELPDGNYEDVLSGKSLTVKSGTAKFTLPAMRSAFFVSEK
ncbi:MAG: alpha-amylase family glycosyl hydrolase [Verrucomicrobia bacterium]|nr:alpha-amylase family glycosyl hydrolase [Verrucomicrobiota bacterium]